MLGLFDESMESADGLFCLVLVLIGLIVGVLDVSDKNSQTFLLASLSIVIVGALGVDALKYITLNNYVVTALRNVLESLLLFIPAIVVVALKTVFSMAKI